MRCRGTVRSAILAAWEAAPYARVGCRPKAGGNPGCRHRRLQPLVGLDEEGTLARRVWPDEGGAAVRRRELLKAAAATTIAAGVAPRLARAERSKTLVFVPTSDLTVLDPIVTFNRPTR